MQHAIPMDQIHAPPKAITALSQSCNWGQRCNSAVVVSRTTASRPQPSRLAVISGSKSGPAVSTSRSVAFRSAAVWPPSRNGPAGGGSVAFGALEGPGESAAPPKTSLHFLIAACRLIRLYAFKGGLCQTAGLVARALLVDHPSLLDWRQLHRLLLGVLALACFYGFFGGSNMLYDIDIDNVNKPYLPIAAGDLSERAAWFLVPAYAASGLALAFTQFGPATAGVYGLALLVAAAYSAPPLRLKNHSATAVLDIGTVKSCEVVGTNDSGIGVVPVDAHPLVRPRFPRRDCVCQRRHQGLQRRGRRREIWNLHFRFVAGSQESVVDWSRDAVCQLVAGIAAAVVLLQLFKRHVLIPAYLVLALFLEFQVWSLDASGYSKKALHHFHLQVWNIFSAQSALLPFI